MSTGKYSARRTGRYSYSGSIASAGDQFFSSVSLLLHGNGSNNANNTSFLDSSSNVLSVTRVGSGAITQGSFTPYSLAAGSAYSTASNGGSIYISSANTDYLTVPAGSLFAYGTGDFTIEMWVYPSSYSSEPCLFAQTTSGINYIFLYITSAGAVSFVGNNAAGINSASSVTLNAWNHIAVVRTSGTVRVYLNGSGGTATSHATDYTNTTYVPTVGRYTHTGVSNFLTDAHISNLRVVKGTGVYTGNFTPPTTPLAAIAGTSLLLSGTNAAIFDNAAKCNLTCTGNSQTMTGVSKFGGASINFDGSGDSLTVTTGSSGVFAFGPGDFTVELWLYPTTVGTQKIVYDSRPLGGNGLYPSIFVSTTNTVRYYTNTAFQITGTTAMTTNTWNHVALVKSSGTTKLYLNGTQEGSSYTDGNTYLVGAQRPMIGDDGSTAGASPFAGYIDDLRVTKGVARYTANFAVPSDPFPNY